MAVELKFTKADNTPWGFRLVGGSDFDTPLTVIKVTEGSIAEEAGMRVGDTVVRVNDTPTASLTHAQAHDLIKEAGNHFTLAVFRGVVGEPISEPKPLPVKPLPSTITEQTLEPGESPVLQIAVPPSENLSEEDLEMAQINESAQITKLQGFKMEQHMEQHSQITQTQVISSEKRTSTPVPVEVQYSVKKEGESVKDKKWSTFLQKPTNPKPKWKNAEAERPKDPPYRVIINKIKRCLNKDYIQEKIDQPSVTAETEITSTETKKRGKKVKEESKEVSITSEVVNEALAKSGALQLSEISQLISETNLSKEEQLALVQKQLLALSQLPVAIQTTLNAVTEQLAKIVETNSTNNNEAPSTNEEGTNIEDTQKGGEQKKQENIEKSEVVDGEDNVPSVTVDNPQSDRVDSDSIKDAPTPAPSPSPEPESKMSREERELIDKKYKAQKIEEERQILEIQQKKSNKKSHFPSMPLQRPIILPGGRKWFDTGDVVPRKINERKYTDELIAETISSQSELIMGKTLGINFLKYKPEPPKSMEHLKHSEVYKMIHSSDKPLRGIAGRPSLVVAEEDICAKLNQNVNGTQTQQNLPAQMEP